MLHTIRSRLSVGKDWYNTARREIKLASNIKIKNKYLAEELELECHKRNGILTYEEYLSIDQFGKNGFYATNDKHGKTDVDERWGMALAKYCLKNGHNTIIEFGCGTGDLGVATCKAYKKLKNGMLTWIGVEIDTRIHKKILENFKRQQVQPSIGSIVETMDELPDINNPLIVFPYCLDNIPPHVFINSQTLSTYPDSLLGIVVSNGTLSEVIIPQDILHKKGLILEDGLFVQKNVTYKLSGWKLRKGQRAYIPTDAFRTIYDSAQKFDNATLLIIDEFRKNPWAFSPGNLGTPKSLYEKNLISNERARYYRESGEHNLYYPLYKDSLFKFLSTIGYRSIDSEIEQKRAAQLRGIPWFSLNKNYTTYSLIAKNFVGKNTKVLPILSPQKKIF